jgi:hypothetical protein
MRSELTYCEVLDADVEVLSVRRNRGLGDGGGPDRICLDVEQRCTRTSCPVCTVSPHEILAELRRLNAVH